DVAGCHVDAGREARVIGEVALEHLGLAVGAKGEKGRDSLLARFRAVRPAETTPAAFFPRSEQGHGPAGSGTGVLGSATRAAAAAWCHIFASSGLSSSSQTAARRSRTAGSQGFAVAS